ARAAKLQIIGAAAVDENAKLYLTAKGFFVPKEDAEKVEPPREAYQYTPPTPEERAAREREQDIRQHQIKLAMPRFAGTPLEGRVLYDRYVDARRVNSAAYGGEGYMVEVKVWVPAADFDAQAEAAAAKYEQQQAEEAERIAAHEKRVEAAIASPPAVIQVMGELADDDREWFRWEDSGYRSERQDGRDPDTDPLFFYESVDELLDQLVEPGDEFRTWETLEAFDAEHPQPDPAPAVEPEAEPTA